MNRWQRFSQRRRLDRQLDDELRYHFDRLVADRVVASQVEVALAGHPDMRRYRIDVESIRGLVTLELPAGVDPDVAVVVARGVTGVQDVKLRIAELPVATTTSVSG